MPCVTDLVIKRQAGGSNTYYAGWSFDETSRVTTYYNSGIGVGTLVTIKPGSTYYNGVSIPSWVMSDSWYVSSIKGDRAVLGRNSSGTHNINSPINVANLNGGSTGSTTQEIHTLDHYAAEWFYDTGDGVWFVGAKDEVTARNSLYNAPSNTVRLRLLVTPVSKTHVVNGTDTAYWNGQTALADYSMLGDPPETPSVPSVSIDKYKLTASIENISDFKTDAIKFEVYNDTRCVNSGIITVLTRRAIFTCNVEAGGKYRVRCQAINIYNNSNIYGEWSDFSSEVGTIPATPAGFTVIKASSKTSVHLEWAGVNSATSYDIEYTTNKNYFDGSDATSVVSGIKYTKYDKTGLESGNEYFFRVRAVNDKGESSWSGIKSVILGKEPSAPTTWSSTTTAVTGEKLKLFWVHNSEDGSSQTFAELELIIGGNKETKTIKNTTDEDEKDKTSSYTIDTSQYVEGTKILWRVRTAGITKAYGDWSVQRTVDIYAPPTLTMSIIDKNNSLVDTVSAFPFYISAIAGPRTQAPVSYHLSILSDETYQTIDQVGREKNVNKGEEVFSKYYDTSDTLMVEISASNIDLISGITYKVICVVSMNSGLTAQSEAQFYVNWVDAEYEPDAEIGIDESSYTAYIRPYCIRSDKTFVEEVTLSVYRREFNGDFTEIATNIENGKNIRVADPHPALDYARYRIVAISKTTGGVSYYDPPGYPVQCKAIIIQWDEEWTEFNTSNSDRMGDQPWTGSLLFLPYNIDVSDDNDPDVELVKYIGRSRPVSYYGTQLGSKANWSAEIPKDDKDTLYALRRLSTYMGDVYVREPSGSGYWANVTVSMSQKHDKLTIPVSISLTEVEGGM